MIAAPFSRFGKIVIDALRYIHIYFQVIAKAFTAKAQRTQRYFFFSFASERQANENNRPAAEGLQVTSELFGQLNVSSLCETLHMEIKLVICTQGLELFIFRPLNGKYKK